MDGSNGSLGNDWAGCLPFGAVGDIVGVGINIISGEVYSTKNGVFQGPISKHIFQDYFDVQLQYIF